MVYSGPVAQSTISANPGISFHLLFSFLHFCSTVRIKTYGTVHKVDSAIHWIALSTFRTTGNNRDFIVSFVVPSQNFALGKTTQQSSTYSNGYGLYPASLAVDGNKKTNARNGDQPQCAHTNGGDRNWWRVDFGEKVPVARISITNRGDCCSHRQRDIEIRVRKKLHIR